MRSGDAPVPFELEVVTDWLRFRESEGELWYPPVELAREAIPMSAQPGLALCTKEFAGQCRELMGRTGTGGAWLFFRSKMCITVFHIGLLWYVPVVCELNPFPFPRIGRCEHFLWKAEF
eukprot:IDg7481t1